MLVPLAEILKKIYALFMTRKLNWKRPPASDRTKLFLAKETPLAGLKTVYGVDLRPLDSPVFDQGQEGSCTANAACGAFDFLQVQELRQKQPGVEIFQSGLFEFASRQFLYWNERAIDGDTHQDNGSSLTSSMEAIGSKGLCLESEWPYNPATDLFVCPPTLAYEQAWHHRETHSYPLDNTSLAGLKSCLSAGFPFVFGITVYSSFMTNSVAQAGVVPMPRPYEALEGGHALLCVGFDDLNEVFLFKNSWGTGWGSAGYGSIPYAYLTSGELASDFWTLRRT